MLGSAEKCGVSEGVFAQFILAVLGLPAVGVCESDCDLFAL